MVKGLRSLVSVLESQLFAKANQVEATRQELSEANDANRQG